MAETHPAFRIEGPALISFSGGRTSGFMLHEIVCAHNGRLPDDVIVAFANTGKEREETLRFVYECGSRWGVRIRWVEWRDTVAGFEEVGFNSAARNGEPFAALIAKKQFLPNAVTRYCTTKLKIETMKKLMLSLGFKRWNNVVGLRYDEGRRVLKQLDRNAAGKERWTSVMPLSKAKVTKTDVMRFWLGDNADPILLTHPLPQGFDLGLRDYEGNCDLCFLKSYAARCALVRENPGMVDWWVAQEHRVAPARFVTEYSYADLARHVADQSVMTFLDDEDFDAECGLHCGAELAE